MIPMLIIIVTLTLFCAIKPTLAQEIHPTLLFKNISEVPGWKYKDEQPYKLWNKRIPFLCSNYYMNYNFSDTSKREGEKADYCYKFALAYLITGNSSFAEKAVEGLRHLGESKINGLNTSGCINDYAAAAPGKYAICYDWMYNYIQQNYPELDPVIRDKLGKWAHYLYTNYTKFSGDVGTRFQRAYSLGMVATVLQNYTSPYESCKDEWLTAATKWLFEEDFTGRPALGLYYNKGGLCRGIEGYSSRWIYNIITWLHVYKKNYNQEIPWKLSRDIYNILLATNLPDGKRPNHQAQGSAFWITDSSYYVLDLLPTNEAEWHRWWVEFVGEGNIDMWKGYIFYDKHIVSPKEPNFTTFISSDAESAVFRKDWSIESDYLWLKIFSMSTVVNRDCLLYTSPSPRDRG